MQDLGRLAQESLATYVGRDVTVVVRAGDYLVMVFGKLMQGSEPDDFMVRGAIHDARGQALTTDEHYHRLRNGTMATFRASDVAAVTAQDDLFGAQEATVVIQLRSPA